MPSILSQTIPSSQSTMHAEVHLILLGMVNVQKCRSGTHTIPRHAEKAQTANCTCLYATHIHATIDRPSFKYLHTTETWIMYYIASASLVSTRTRQDPFSPLKVKSLVQEPHTVRPLARSCFSTLYKYRMYFICIPLHRNNSHYR